MRALTRVVSPDTFVQTNYMTPLILFCMSVLSAPISFPDTSQPLKSSPNDLVDALHTTFGDNHSRAVHAKGIVLEGLFTPDGSAAALTKAAHLQSAASKVTVRFSNFTGIPDIADNNGAANPRGLAIKFSMPGGFTTDIVTHSFNGFPTSNSDDFRDLLLSIHASGPDAAKPTALDKFLDGHPIAKTFLTTQHNPASYATIGYFGVNSFKFTNKEGVSHYIRYQFIPLDGESFLTAEQFSAKTPNYLQDELRTRIAAHPIRFQLFAQIAEEGDMIEDPSRAWPDSRKRVSLGVIELQKLTANTIEEDKKLFFIPNNLPIGIETADPMLNFRSSAYPISVQHRQ